MDINKVVRKVFEGLGTAPGESGVLTKTAKLAHDGFFKPVTTAKGLIEKAREKLRKL